MSDTETQSSETTDRDAVRAFAFQVWNYKQGEMVSMMIHLGDRLGLYRSLQGKAPMSSSELAEATGLQERWLREWLFGQAAAGLLDYHDEDRFQLNAVAAEVLANEATSLEFAAGAFTSPLDSGTLDSIAQAFETGTGLSYQQLGPCAAHRTERMLGPWARQALVPTIVPALNGLHDRLTAGIDVADIGCGSGVALLALAAAYPASRFTGIDPSAHAIERAQASAQERSIANATFVVGRGEDITPVQTDDPNGAGYDFIITFDCLHDMTQPAVVTKAIKNALRPDGTWLIKDIRCHEDFRQNQRNPMLAMLYGFSITACMSSALSEPGGAGLGTVGLPPSKLEAMTTDAGFSTFEIHDFEDPANLYYEVRH